MTDPSHTPDRPPDWEAFYRDYRKPGYVPGYEITSKLGGGAFGLVFKATKESIGKDYAIKFLKVDDTEVRQAVYRELDQVQHFAQVDHPNLVQIEDRGEVDGIPYLVMQYAGADTLRDRIPEGPPDPMQREEGMGLFLQACRGVAALHHRSLVHFDLKPANVFLKGAVARVGDYGLSKLVTHSRGSLSMGRGTPYYMAPEILQRRGDERSDIYSLGVMLYELLTGQVPFTGDSKWEVLQKHEHDEPAWPAHLTIAERAVLQRCLRKDPARRFASVDELLGALSPTRADGRPALAMQPPPLPSPLPSSVDTGVIPSCLPPPLPPPPPAQVAASHVTPPPLPKRKRRSKASRVVPVILVLVAVYFVFGGGFDRHKPSSRSRVQVSQSTNRSRSVQQDQGSVRARVDALVKDAQQRMRSAARRGRMPDLQQLQFDKVDAPRDIDEYVHMVENLADAPSFSAGHATKLERYGRATFLAAVALLQDYDYSDGADCRCAAHVTALLAHLTGLSGMQLSWDGHDPDRPDICRFHANADAWRRLAEQFAATEDDYEELLEAKGRGRSQGG